MIARCRVRFHVPVCRGAIYTATFVTDEPAPLILVVDDYDGARAMHQRLLTAYGFRVAEARSGSEALA